MALVLKFTVETGSNCKSLIFTETTGAYNNPNNLTGWGTPNTDLSDVDTSTLQIKNYLTGVTYDLINITPSDSSATTTITTEDLLINGTSIGDVTLPDGLYGFVYHIVLNDSTIYEQTIAKVILCESCCKIKSKACTIDMDCGCCNDDCADEIWKFLQAYTELKIIEYSAYCGSAENIIKKIKSLQSLLKTFDCKNC